MTRILTTMAALAALTWPTLARAALGLLMAALVALAWPTAAAAQACAPMQQSFGWTQPNNVAIADENAVRWPTDATIRIAYGGRWCPEEPQVELKDENGVGVPTQVRFVTPFNLVENAPEPLSVLEIDPVPILERRADYFLTVRPPNPSLPAYAEYYLEMRTRTTPMAPMPDFEGVLGVELWGDRCDLQAGPFLELDQNNPACLVSTRLRIKVLFQPADRADVAYIIYRTSSTPLDENGDPVLAEADNTALPVHIQPGVRALDGLELPVFQTPIEVLYAPLPRRDCFSVRMLDEWGRERGDLDAEACIDLIVMPPCPDGCMGEQCMFGFPEPNPFETNPPLPGQACGNLGLNGADPDRPVPPIGEEPPADAGGGGDTDDAGVGANGDGGKTDGDAGNKGGGGSGGGSTGCFSQAPGAPGGSGWWFLLMPIALAGMRRRATREDADA